MMRLIGQIVCAGSHQERPELPFGSLHRGEITLLQELREKPLDQVLRGFDVVPFATNKRIERILIRRAKRSSAARRSVASPSRAESTMLHRVV